MKKTPRRKKATVVPAPLPDAYMDFAGDIAALLDEARRQAARSINAILTATYWEIGRRIVEFEQGGESKADYGQEIIERLSRDLTIRFGRGFGRSNLFQMRTFYQAYPQIVQTASGQFSEVIGDRSSRAQSMGVYLISSGSTQPQGFRRGAREDASYAAITCERG